MFGYFKKRKDQKKQKKEETVKKNTNELLAGMSNAELERRLEIELARRSFFDYCCAVMPKFYKRNRKYLQELCDELQDFYESDDEVAIVNMPPRHGKSLTAMKFAEWIFGRNIEAKIMTGSYNETLSTNFSKAVRNSIMEQKADATKIVYSDIFPRTKIKRGDSAMKLWALEGGYNNYLATSPTGTATGFGASCFPSGTLIATPYGNIPIETIVDKNIRHSLSLSLKDGKIKVGKITAFRRKIAHEHIEIETDSGRKIIGTIDHLFYTNERGYTRADKLEVGQTFKTLPGSLFGLPTTENGTWGEMLGMLQQGPTRNGRTGLLGMWEEVQNPSVRANETDRTWRTTNVLHERLLMQVPSARAAKTQVFDMQPISAARKEVLFGRMQSERQSVGAGSGGQVMQTVREDIHSIFNEADVLFEGLCQQGSFKEDDGQGEFTLQTRRKLHEGISGSAPNYIEKGPLQMPRVRSEGTEESDQTLSASDEFTHSSHRPQSAEQCAFKFNNFMRELSYSSPQDEVITKITAVSKEEVVYDIQVDGYHNFFANGILVHNCLIIDDLIKNSMEAYNADVLEKHWDWFTNTMLSRLEEGGKIIIIMTRWASQDLAGRALKHFTVDDPKRVRHINMKALQDDGTMLCEEVLSRKSFESKKKAMGEDIAMANYQQQPLDLKGKLYTHFKTYKQLPEQKDIDQIVGYTDTADTGSDYLVSIIAAQSKGLLYVKDIVCTLEAMEVTEPLVAKVTSQNRVERMIVESNNGGRGFARNVERILREELKDNYPVVDWFHQSENKQARILSNATNIMRFVLFPEDWEERWPEYAEIMKSYQKEGKNKFDDPPDATTGLVEKTLLQGNIGVREMDDIEDDDDWDDDDY